MSCNFSLIQNAAWVVGGISLAAAGAACLGAGKAAAVIGFTAAGGGVVAGVAIVALGVFGLICPCTYDSPQSREPGGLAHMFSHIFKDGALLTTISSIGVGILCCAAAI